MHHWSPQIKSILIQKKYNTEKKTAQQTIINRLLFTLAWFVLDVDGLGLVVAFFILYAHQVRVRLHAEAGPKCHHMLIAAADHFHHLSTLKLSSTLSSHI